MNGTRQQGRGDGRGRGRGQNRGRGQGRGRGKSGRGRIGRTANSTRRDSDSNHNPPHSTHEHNSSGDHHSNNNRGRGWSHGSVDGARGRGGDGRGRRSSRGGGRDESRHQRHQQQQPPPPPPSRKPPTSTSTTDPPKKNGEKGAEAHTVSESERIQLTKDLIDFREDDDRDRMEFSSNLTNTERKFIHSLASQLGLCSKSTGQGNDRRITVTKRNDNKRKATASDVKLPVLKIGRGGMLALATHVQKFPPTHTEEMESRETGASLVEAMQQQNQNGTSLATTFQELNKGTPVEAVKTQVQVKYVDLQRRMARHAFYQQRKQKQLSVARDCQVLMHNRSNLPAFARQDEIVATVANTPVTIIQGETGCGKSTQCPQFLLDINPVANIVVTQRKL
jgi:hypothetical protein